MQPNIIEKLVYKKNIIENLFIYLPKKCKLCKLKFDIMLHGF